MGRFVRYHHVTVTSNLLIKVCVCVRARIFVFLWILTSYINSEDGCDTLLRNSSYV
jgi:hypothetical protein